MSKLKNTKVLTTCALLVALGTILGFLKIVISESMEIRFGFFPIAVAGAMFGPGPAAIVGAVIDITGYLVKPTGAFFPGFTLSNVLSGIVYGLLLHRKEIGLKHIVIAEVLHFVFIYAILNTLWISMLYGMSFTTYFWVRLPKQIFTLFVNIILLRICIGPVMKFAGRAGLDLWGESAEGRA